jgi:hypothetical protein
MFYYDPRLQNYFSYDPHLPQAYYNQDSNWESNQDLFLSERSTEELLSGYYDNGENIISQWIGQTESTRVLEDDADFSRVRPINFNYKIFGGQARVSGTLYPDRRVVSVNAYLFGRKVAGVSLPLVTGEQVWQIKPIKLVFGINTNRRDIYIRGEMRRSGGTTYFPGPGRHNFHVLARW